MSCFVIEGGHRLSGEIRPQGAKNEVLQILCAVLLTREKVTVHNVPDILDVNNLIALLQDMGVKVDKLGRGSYSFCAEDIDTAYLRGYALTAKPGGDKIGRRRLDTHFEGLKRLGAEFTYNKDNATFELRSKKLRGTYMLLDEASVTGTANIVMAAVLAEGTTTIYNAACCAGCSTAWAPASAALPPTS